MNKKDHTRKPVIRGPLPEKDKITLCELVIWRATGKARSAAVLRRFMRRHQGQRQSTELRDSFKREAATVVSLCRKNDLSPYGSVDGNPHEPFSKDYFLSDVYADPVSDSIGFDLLAWPSAGPYPDENPEEPRELPTYHFVRFLRSDLLSFFGQADQSAAETTQASAGGAQDDADPAQAIARTSPLFVKKGGAGSTGESPGPVPKDWYEQVVAWFVEEYVPAHADDNPHPNRDDSYIAARKKFPGWLIKRTAIWREDIWRNRAPVEWKKRGPK